MKKYFVLLAVFVVLTSCDSTTYESIEEPGIIEGKVTYEANVKAVINANCIVCHTVGGSGSFRPLTTYAEVKDAVQNTNLLDRIQRQNGESGLMPQTGRMPQDKISIILQWNTDGLLEN